MDKQIVAFDIGDKRIGVAASDPFGEYAIPCDTYFRTGNYQSDVQAMLEIANARGAGLIVCGLPLNADGTESEQTRKTRKFAEALQAKSDIPVVFEDERFTTREARRDLVSVGVSTKKDIRKKSIDSVAAAYILEGYLAQTKKGEKAMKEEQNNYEEDDSLVELVDEEGVSHWFEHLMTFEYKGEWYVALTQQTDAEEAEDDEEGDEVAIYHLVGDEDDEQLETIEDDELLDEVFAEFCNQYEDFEDADEAEALEPDEE